MPILSKLRSTTVFSQTRFWELVEKSSYPSPLVKSNRAKPFHLIQTGVIRHSGFLRPIDLWFDNDESLYLSFIR